MHWCTCICKSWNTIGRQIRYTIRLNPGDCFNHCFVSPVAIVSQQSASLQHTYEHGRRFHERGDGGYDFPDDEEEAGRLDLQHLSFKKIAGDRLALAPLPNGDFKALDLGCGTGIWTIEFAKEHPAADIVGLDIDPTNLPKSAPENCTFVVGNAEADWRGLFSHQFEYLHCRALVAVVKDWPQYFRRAYNTLNPGGWIELQEFCNPPGSEADPSLNESTSPYLRWAGLLGAGLAKTGRSFDASRNFEQPLREAGFVDIHLDRYRFPVGPWPKEKDQKAVGKMTLQNLFEYVQASGLGLFTRVHGWSANDVEKLAHEVKQEMENCMERQYYQPMSVCLEREVWRLTNSTEFSGTHANLRSEKNRQMH